jgi:hypothetical protein
VTVGWTEAGATLLTVGWPEAGATLLTIGWPEAGATVLDLHHKGRRLITYLRVGSQQCSAVQCSAVQCALPLRLPVPEEPGPGDGRPDGQDKEQARSQLAGRVSVVAEFLGSNQIAMAL